tara:strand:+ start:2089 stop:3972 length:1884 start_codon:yes stop_codon:yes gene_type:complete
MRKNQISILKINLTTIFLIIVNVICGQHDLTSISALKTARMLEKKGDVNGAIAIYEGIIENNPNHIQSVQNLKNLFLSYQKYEKGIQFYKGQIIKYPNDFKNYSQLGELYYLNGQSKDAYAIWSSGINKFKHNRSFYRTMIAMFGKYGLDEDISKILYKGKATFGKSFLSYEAGAYYQAHQNYDMAMEQYILHLIYEPNRNGIIERRILQMSDEDDALDIIENKLLLASKNEPTKILNVLSEFYFKQQKYHLALKTKEQWTNSGKKDFNDWLKFANNLRKEGAYNFSISAYEYILTYKLNTKIIGKALLGLAQTFEDQITPVNEYHIIPYFYDNNIFFEDPFGIYASISAENLKTSLSIYDSLLSSPNKSPVIAEAYFRLGDIQYKILQDFDQAYFLFNKALSNNPKNTLKTKIILRIADALLAVGQTEKAINFLEKEMKTNPNSEIELKSILIQFLVNNPESTLEKVDSSFFSLNPLDPSFNDLMELKTLFTKYYRENEIDKSAFLYFQKSEFYLRQKKIGDAIEELDFIIRSFPEAKIIPLVKLRSGLLYYRLKNYDKALEYALSLDGTDYSDKGIIFSGQIYEMKFFEIDNAIQQYMRIIDDYPQSIYSEPIRYHIRKIQNKGS